MRRALLLLVLVGLFSPQASAQMDRQRANPDRPVDELFWSTAVIGTSSVTNLSAGDLNYSIKHAFGLVSSGIENLYGVDGSANIRFGLDYGVRDWLSIGMGRSRFDKVYDFRAKANILRQTVSGSSPLEVAVLGDLGITTVKNGFSFTDRLSYAGMLMFGRRFSESLAIQVSPTVTHFNTVFIARDAEGNVVEEENTHVGVALAANWRLNELFAVVVEYVPVLGGRSDNTTDAVSVGLDIETGGHVFQLFFSTSDWLTEQHMLARNDDDFFAGDFRWGFNVHRTFAF